MSVVSEILNLRRDKFSSVTRLVAALGRQGCPSENCAHIPMRDYAVREAADLVLLNVAAHAAEQLSDPSESRKSRRAVVPFQRKPRRSDPGQLHQRRLFA
jgi:hypothetical protein